MNFDFPAFAAEVNKNAHEKGWYAPPASLMERVALIHCEWSEAVQAWREGVDAYVPTPASFECKQGMLDKCPGVCDDKCPHYHPTTYKFYEIGPRGYAVELIDGVLRILEWMASVPAAHHELGQIRESWQTMNRGERYDLEHMELTEAVAPCIIRPSAVWIWTSTAGRSCAAVSCSPANGCTPTGSNPSR